MLRPVRMCMLDYVVPEDRKVRLIEALHKAGETQVELFEDSHLQRQSVVRDAPLERVNEVSLLLIRARGAIDVLSRFDKSERNLLEDFLEIDRIDLRKVPDLSYGQVISKAEAVLGSVDDRIKSLEAERHRIEERLSRCSEDERKLRKLSDLDVELGALAGSKRLDVIVGTIQKAQLGGLEAVSKKLKACAVIAPKMQGKKSNEMPVAIVVAKEVRGEAEKEARALGFEVIDSPLSGKPSKILDGISRERKELLSSKQKNAEKLKAVFDKHYSDLRAAEELLLIEKERCEVFYSFGRTKNTILLRLWVSKAKCAKVERLIEKETGGAFFLKKDDDPKNAPVLLDNPRVARPFESLVHLFGTPKYNEIDPTVFFVFFFPLFFGFMLTDAVYGLALLGVAIYVQKKYARYSKGATDAAIILALCGAATIVLGVLTGSYLGDFVGKYVLGNSTGSQAIAVWADPLFGANAIVFIVAVCVIGFIQLYIGFMLGAYDNLKKGNKRLALTHYISWFVLLAGGLFVAGSMFPAESPLLPKAFADIGMGVCGLAVFLQFLGKKGMFFTGLTGLIGNVLSYARLLAMALTTSGIALSFNVLASLCLAIPYVGIVIAIFVFLIGHTINIVLNTMGAFVQSMRLQYVEWFGTFYEGGGVRFTPFKENRRYTIKD